MPGRTGSGLIDRWHATDVVAILHRRLLTGDDGRVFGVWERQSGRFRTVPQHIFLRQAVTLAVGYRDHDVSPGQVVLVDCTDPGATWLAYCAAVLARAVPMVQPVHLGSRQTQLRARSHLQDDVGAVA